MARTSQAQRNADYILSNACIADAKTEAEQKLYIDWVTLADKRAFPVNMRNAISRISLNDAAMIGYIRGMNDAVIVAASPTHSLKELSLIHI